jgi:hypothetical protein
MRMRNRLAMICALTAAVAAGGNLVRGQAAAGGAGGTGAATLSPEFAAAFEKLASSDAAEREKAITALQQLYVGRMRQTIAMQEVMLRVQQDLAAQLRLLTGRMGPEADADTRAAGLLDFNQAVARWASDVMALPADERKAMLAWGTNDAVMPLIGQLYGRDVDTRLQAVKDLAKLQGATAQVNWMLLQLLNDPERAVSLTAMDVLYYRPPDAAIITALWNRATAQAQANLRNVGRPSRYRSITVGERSLQVYDNEQANYQRNNTDVDIAADLLVKFKDPQVGEKLDELFVELGRTMTNANDSRWRVVTPNYGGGQVFSKLIDAYQPKEAVRFFARVLEQTTQDGNDSTMPINGQPEKVRMSSRIEAAVMLLRATGQNMEEYGLVRMPNYTPERYALKGGVAEEQAMVKKLQEWWKTHAKDFGGDGLP